MKNVVIGAGLVGSLLSIFLRRRGYDVDVFEKRDDIRKLTSDEGRSINLIITEKGIEAVKELGLWDEIEKLTVPVKGRMIHDRDGNTTYQPYSKDNTECNFSISRKELNQYLLTCAENEGAKFHFKKSLKEVDFDKKNASFESEDVSFNKIFGTDGSGSQTRKELIKFLNAQESIQDLGVSYKELFMPADPEGNYVIDKNSLHIWPRGDYMLMALPNIDGSFTMTLYLPNTGDMSFENIKTRDDVQKLFEKDFKDAIPLMPNLHEDFFNNPVGSLGTVRCRPWHYKDLALLLGDAAHGVVPFFGQGMNAGFDDCTVLGNLIDQNSDWSTIFWEFENLQKKNGDAIADMAIENYREMSEKTGDKSFLLKKEVEAKIGREFPDKYLSRYSMVVHSTISYSKAMEVGIIQEEILSELCTNLNDVTELDLNKANLLIDEKLIPYYLEKKINLKPASHS